MTTLRRTSLTMLIPWLAMITIVVSLTGPILAYAAPVDDDIPNESKVCGEGEGWNDETSQCEPVPTPTVAAPGQNDLPDLPDFPVTVDPTFIQLPTEVPVDPPVDPTEVPAVEPVMEPSGPVSRAPGEEGRILAGSGTVIVIYHLCPAGFDFSTATIEDDFIPCTGQQDGVDFELSLEGVSLGTEVTGSGGPSRLVFEALPVGDYLLTQLSPPPGGMAAMCQINSPSGNTRPYNIALLAAGSWSLDLAADETAFCDWYVAEGASGTVTVNKWQCPEGYEAAEVTIEDLVATCVTPMDDIWFTLTDAVGPSALQTAGGTLTFADVPAGGHTLMESIPAGFDPLTVAACRVDEAAPILFDAPDGILALPPIDHADTVIVCDWYNVPRGDAAISSIAIDKYTCPPGTFDASTRDELATTCTEPGAGIEFVVTFEGGRTRTQATDAGGHITFGDVPRGSFTIQESMPPEYETTIWACLYSGLNPGGDIPTAGELPLTVAADGAFLYESEFEVVDFSCVVYNIPGDGDNTVTVYKYVCPPGVNPDTDMLTAACVRGGDGILFEFVDGIGIHPAAVTGGTVEWTDVVIGAEGELQIIETIPPGYGDPIVICDGVRMASANGFVVPQPGSVDPFHVECDWFNLAENTSDLIVVKHECPPGYDPEAAGADPDTDCPTLTDGVVFDLGSVATVMHATTGDAGAGTARFDGLAPGDYHVTEAIPEGTALVFVSECFGNAVGSVRPFPLATGGTLDLTVHAGEEITCHWFNVPEDPEGTVTVHKFLCTTETFVSDVDCQVYEGGQEFELLAWNGSAWVTIDTATTDGAGDIVWSGLDGGSYRIREVGATWCHIEAISAISIDEFAMESGTDLVFFVSNCGGEPGTPGETPTKYPNTGVPPTRKDP